MPSSFTYWQHKQSYLYNGLFAVFPVSRQNPGYSIGGPLGAQILLPDILALVAGALRQQLAKTCSSGVLVLRSREVD